MEKIEEILMNDELYREHFVAKYPPKYEFSGKINPSILGRDSSVDKLAKWLARYIGFRLIEENFPEHTSRRIWKKEFEMKYGIEAKKFLDENKLRTNTSLQGLWSLSSLICYSFLAEEIPTLIEKAKGIIKVTEGIDYDKMNNLEKIDFVRGMEDRAYGILQEIRID
jgi:hypothetical protein